MATLAIIDDVIDYDVGDLGEIEFARWCTKAAIVANPTSRDRKGWDFIIELPATGPRYKHDEITAKVQVKATKHGAAGAQIKLDNIGRMATDPLPWFVLFYAFDDAGEVGAAHMLHVDEQFIANAHRVIDAEQSSALHKRRLQINWSDSDRIDHTSPRALLDRLATSIGGSMWSYYEDKARWNTAAMTRRITGSLSFPGTPDEAYARFVDLAIGVIDEMPAEVKEMIDAATGTSVVPEGATIEKSVVTITGHEPEPATIEAHFGSERVVLNARMLTSGFLKMVPLEHHKVRLFTDLVSVIIGANGVSMHVDVPSHAVPISTLGQAGRLLRLLANAGAKLTVRADNFDQTVEVANHRGRGGAQLSDAIAWERAARIANHVGLPHDLAVLPSLTLVQKDQIATFARLLDGARGLSRFIVELNEQTATTAGEAGVVVVPKVLLGEYGAFAVAVVRGAAEVADGTLTIEAPRAELVRAEARYHKDLTPEVFEEMLSEQVAALTAESIPIVTFMSKSPFRSEAT